MSKTNEPLPNIRFQRGQKVRIKWLDTDYVDRVYHLVYPIIGGVHSPTDVEYVFKNQDRKSVLDPEFLTYQYYQLEAVQ